jgi:hypothetical protein
VSRTGLNASAAALADADFARAFAVPEALWALRADLPPTQSLSRDLALNRSVVVLAVAAWQAWVETYISGALTSLCYDPPARAGADATYLRLLESNRALVQLAEREVGRFSTPDVSEVCRLFRLLGDDPRARWSFTDVGGRRSSEDVVGRLNDWVQVRHAIAHGRRYLPAVDVLARTKGGHGSLTHRHAGHCLTFFRKLAHATGHETCAE